MHSYISCTSISDKLDSFSIVCNKEKLHDTIQFMLAPARITHHHISTAYISNHRSIHQNAMSPFVREDIQDDTPCPLRNVCKTKSNSTGSSANPDLESRDGRPPGSASRGAAPSRGGGVRSGIPSPSSKVRCCRSVSDGAKYCSPRRRGR